MAYFNTYFNNYLIGATKNHELVFANFGTRQNGDGQVIFSASFDTVKPFNVDTCDLSYVFDEYVANLGAAQLWEMCDEYDCKPSELAERMFDCGYDITKIIDCSIYPEYYDIDGCDWCFESVRCGQYDTRNDIEEITLVNAYNKLHELWDKYHLKPVDDSVTKLSEKLAKIFAKVDEVEWITDYIKRHIDEL